MNLYITNLEYTISDDFEVRNKVWNILSTIREMMMVLWGFNYLELVVISRDYKFNMKITFYARS